MGSPVRTAALGIGLAARAHSFEEPDGLPRLAGSGPYSVETKRKGE